MADLLLGLIGAHIHQSRTPVMHEREAAEHGLSCEYRLIDLDALGLTVAALPELLVAAEREGFAGLNVTHPCKQVIMPLLSELSGDSRNVGAVNTVLLQNGVRDGHNTDWWAFRESFLAGLPGAALRRIVQLGAGGAGAATAYASLMMDAGHVDVFDVVPDRARALAARLGGMFPGRIDASDDLAMSMAHADGVIHATPVGMASHPGIAVPTSMLRPDLWVAELVYVPLETELLRGARALGCRTLEGSGMAVYQAVEAFRLFTGRRPDIARMRRFFEIAAPLA